MRTSFVIGISTCSLCSVFWAVQSADADTATGARGAVATVHPLATDAGIAAMEAGGNAVDAAIAAALTLGVVDNHNSGLGGGCFILLRTADGALVAIDGRETAPAKATRDLYLDAGRRLGKKPNDLSTSGPLAVGTPGALAAYALALEQQGRLALPDLLRRAAEIAERGFPIDSRYAANLKITAEALRQYPGARNVLFKEDGSPYREDEHLKQPDLARTYRMIAEQGPTWFYRGELAERVGAWMKMNGGILTASDFAAYRSKRREPIVSTYRGYQIIGMPPPSGGGILVAQILNILEHFDLEAMHATDPATCTHVVAEAMKLAFADRAHWLGDADFVDVPRGLVGKEYAEELAKRIDLDRAIVVEGHGVPPGDNRDFFASTPQSAIRNPQSAAKHTTHIAAADAEGNWVAITATVNTSFGAKVIVPGTGLVLNNEMDDFSIAPGVPNTFGLIGAAANEIAPGKRPLSSMSPTIVLKDGQPALTVGAAGGPKIISQVVLAIVRTVDLGMSIDDTVAAPRFHHQWIPRRLLLEKRCSSELPWALAGKGHVIQQMASGGVMQAIARSRDRPEPFIAVSDPRVPGKASGR